MSTGKENVNSEEILLANFSGMSLLQIIHMRKGNENFRLLPALLSNVNVAVISVIFENLKKMPLTYLKNNEN